MCLGTILKEVHPDNISCWTFVKHFNQFSSLRRFNTTLAGVFWNHIGWGGGGTHYVPSLFLLYLLSNYVSVNSKDHPSGDPRGLAHFSCPRGQVFAPLSFPGVFNQSKSSIILKKARFLLCLLNN